MARASRIRSRVLLPSEECPEWRDPSTNRRPPKSFRSMRLVLDKGSKTKDQSSFHSQLSKIKVHFPTREQRSKLTSGSGLRWDRWHRPSSSLLAHGRRWGDRSIEEWEQCHRELDLIVWYLSQRNYRVISVITSQFISSEICPVLTFKSCSQHYRPFVAQNFIL